MPNAAAACDCAESARVSPSQPSSASDCWGAQNLGSYYAMYLISRGLRAFRPQIDRLGEIDWYDRYVDFLKEFAR